MRLSIHMMVLNGARVVERALRPFAKMDAEVVVVDTGSTDGTPEEISHLCGDVFPLDYGKEARLRCVIAARLSPGSHPGMFFRDSAPSWRMAMPGPFTGGHILRDWAAARNIGLDMCKGDYILKLDADDELIEGQARMPAVLGFLDSHPGIDFLMCPYEIMELFTPNPLYGFSITDHMETITMYDRLWRNKPDIRFNQAIHEYLVGKRIGWDGQPNWSIIAQGLRFRDWRDSPGNGVRISHRNLKVFMREYEVLEYQERMEGKGLMTPGFLLSTIGEVTDADPVVALTLLRKAVERDPSRISDPGYQLDLGRAYAAWGQDRQALDAYREAARLAPRSASACLALGSQLLRMGLPGWEGWLSHGIAMAEAMSGFNVDHREVRRARTMIAGTK
jgi:glycosyltransferase involved in cell wall biosynthesis